MHTVCQPEENDDRLGAACNLANAFFSHGEYVKAETMHRETFAEQRRVEGPDHLHTLSVASILANILSSQGREYRIRYDVPRDACGSAAGSGSRPPTDVGDVGNLAGTLGEQGTYNEAQTMYHELLAVHRRVLGPEHPQTLRDGQQSGQRTRCARHARRSRDDVHCTKRCLWFSGG